jgi:hypothetical protein
MSLADIIAAKKAAALKAQAQNEQTEVALADLARANASTAPAEKELPSPIAALEEAQAQAPEKPLSFAEKMALKKASTSQATAPAGSVSTPLVVSSIGTNEKKGDTVAPVGKVATSPAVAASSSTEAPAPIPVSEDTTTGEHSEADKQAYADIKARLDTLAEMSGTDLESGMKELKKALMQNPTACMLMEDADIGQLVIALRKLTGEALIEASTSKKTGSSRSKQVDLSDPTAVAAIFDEL